MDFADIKGRGEAALEEARANAVQESLTLDFKSQADSGPSSAMFDKAGNLTKEGRAVLGKALSAFSNSAGGVIVIGVLCKPNADKIDCVDALEPIDNWQRALSVVSSAVGDLLQPKNDGVDVYGFPSAADAGKGYLAINVPRSERRPHMSMAAGSKGYYKRSGSSSYMMEHFDIEDAFKRLSVPELELEAHTAREGDGFRLTLFIANTGKTSARYPRLVVRKWDGPKPSDDDVGPAIVYSTFSTGWAYSGEASFIVHPQEKLPIARLSYKGRERRRFEPRGSDVTVMFDYELSALDSAVKKGRAVVVGRTFSTAPRDD